MATQKELFDEMSRLFDGCEVVKPHLTEDEYKEHVDKVFNNYKLYKMSAYSTCLERAFKDVTTND